MSIGPHVIYINASMSRHIPYTHENGAETMWIPLMGILMLCVEYVPYIDLYVKRETNSLR